QERRREVHPGACTSHAGPGRARPDKEVEAGGDRRRHLHDHEPRRLRLALRHADHPAAPGRDPGRRDDREAPGGRDRRERERRPRHPDLRLPGALLRPPSDRRRRRRQVPVEREEDPREGRIRLRLAAPGIFLLAFAVRLAAIGVVGFETLRFGDAKAYLFAAKELVRTGSYPLATEPFYFRAPGYPVFL